MRPSFWLRLTAVLGAAGTLVAVISGSAGLGDSAPGAGRAGASAAGRRGRGRVGRASPAAVPVVWSRSCCSGSLQRSPHQGSISPLPRIAFTAAVVSAAATFRGEAAAPGSVRDYVTLTKPRIMSLLLLTGLCGMVVGAEGCLPAWLVAATMAGLALACGGASALNHVLDADIDRLMGKRTRSRPVAAGRVPAPYALEFGLALSALSFVLLAGVVNTLTAVLALVGNLFYVLVYTRYLKRSTPQNIVIGGAAGAVPPLVGWAAATGNLTLPALVLFAVVFLWTPPHFWALALLIKRDYAAAGVPMLPVVRGERETARQIVLYTVGLVAFTLAPALWGQFGLIYLVSAVALGASFLWFAWRLKRERTPRRAALLFHYSLAYLALLFVAMAVDSVIA